MWEAPIGYKTPSFPSLYWPLGVQRLEYQNAFLYNVHDIWKFTVLWSIIFMLGFYTTAAGVAVFTHTLKRNNDIGIDDGEHTAENGSSSPLGNGNSGKASEGKKSYAGNLNVITNKAIIGIIITYLIMGLVQSFLSGSLIAVLIAQIYNSENFPMSTWIPFTTGLIVVLFNLVTSYSLTSVIL